MKLQLVSLCLMLAGSSPLYSAISHAHDGALDVYGCHPDRDRKYYHCHQGAYSRLSFDSKTQMVQRLKNQHIALGRPWPYDDTSHEQHVNSFGSQTIHEQTIHGGIDLEQSRRAKYSQLKQSPARPGTIVKAGKTKTEPAPTSVKLEARQTNTQTASVTRQSAAANRKRIEPELKVWIAEIRSDGQAIFESLEGERFILDDRGDKVIVGRRES